MLPMTHDNQSKISKGESRKKGNDLSHVLVFSFQLKSVRELKKHLINQE